MTNSDDKHLHDLQRRSFDYFSDLCNPDNGLVADTSSEGSPASIAAVGFGLSCYVIGVERGFLSRAESLHRCLNTLRFFDERADDRQTGHKGFYYHFLDMKSGHRVWKCELSTIDTALLLLGALTAAAYFDRDTGDERELRELTASLCARADWVWAQNRDSAGGGPDAAVAQSWKPRGGWRNSRWTGYNEALLLYVLALGSPSHPLPAASYEAWHSTYRWKNIYGHHHLYGGPLFLHQFSHCWIDFRNIRDAPMREHDLDYFENSRRATLIQREYAIRNPRGWQGYGANRWGLTAGLGPGPCRRRIDGAERKFYGYRARGAPFGPDDGTLAPWSMAASLPFAPEIALPAIRACLEDDRALSRYGFAATYNKTFPSPNGGVWRAPHAIGIDAGPVVMMIENFRSGLLWNLLRQSPLIVRGLRRCGFREWQGTI